MIDDLSDWMPAAEIVRLAMFDLDIDKPKEELLDADIRAIMRYIGLWASGIDLADPADQIIGLFGVGIMLTVTLLEFPEYYERYQLSQVN